MKTGITGILPLAALLVGAGCTSGSEWTPQYNVPEGIYISGGATKFSTETAYGAFSQMEDSRLYEISTWIGSEGGFRLSMTGPDNQPVVYGGDAEATSDGTTAFALRRGAPEMSVEREGFYRVIYSESVGKITLIPYLFRMTGDEALTESGEREIVFDAPEYDNVNHVVTWKSSSEPETVLAGKYMFRYTESGVGTVPLTSTSTESLSTVLTGMEASVKTNVLSDVPAELTSSSNVSLRLKKKGSYILTVRYDVKAAKFYGLIDGTEFIVPEPSGMSEVLYMAAEDGEWKPMTPCGTAGNGVFWTLGWLDAGRGVRWSVTGSDSDSFCSAETNDGFHVSSGFAVPESGGAQMIFVDLYNKIISFEKPVLYGMGDCFGGEDAAFEEHDGKLSVTTSAEGNLRMYATSAFNGRDWDSMEIGISRDELCYRGVGPELTPTPVTAGVPVEIDLRSGKATLKVTMSQDVPFSGEVHMITDEYGSLNWGAQDEVISLNKVWNDDSRWIYVRWFPKGARLRFSTERVFGRGEFTGLGNDTGYAVEDGYVIIPDDGTYGICVNLGGRKLSVLPVTIYTYGTASADTWGTKLDDPFTVADDGVTLSYTVPNTGRLRFNPLTDGFDFSSWQRELYVDLETMDIRQRLAGMDEPNADYVWNAGTVINLDFRTLKADIRQ